MTSDPKKGGREIKFRAFNTTDQPYKMEYCGLERIGGFHEPLGHNIMQFTGLTDKNGREIYEGDIYGSPVELRCIVEWDTDGFILRFLDERIQKRYGRQRLVALIDKMDKCLGNINENGELLDAG